MATHNPQPQEFTHLFNSNNKFTNLILLWIKKKLNKSNEATFSIFGTWMACYECPFSYNAYFSQMSKATIGDYSSTDTIYWESKQLKYQKVRFYSSVQVINLKRALNITTRTWIIRVTIKNNANKPQCLTSILYSAAISWK